MRELSEWNLRLGLAGGDTAAVIVSALALAVIVFGVRDALALGNRRRSLALGALRVLTALVAWLFVLQPEWVVKRATEVEGRIAVLLDVSRSMSVRAGSDTRLGAARQLVQTWLGADPPQVALYAFGSELRPLGLETLGGPLRLDDDTRLGAAVERVVAEAGGELGAVVVLSDGADRSPAWSAARFEKLGVRVHGVAFGAETPMPDESIAAVKADPVSFLRQTAEVQVTLQTNLPGGEPITVTLSRDGELVREQTATPDDEGSATLVIPFTPGALGRSVYTVSIPVRPEDAVAENNQRAFLVRVIQDRRRVLLVCGSPGWDSRFLRAFLKADPSIDLITFFILRTANDLTMAPPDELSLIPFPTDELFNEHLSSFDVVIFQDFDYAPYQMARYLPRVRDYVVAGGGLIMVGGSRSFGAGGYDQTPLAEVLPVVMEAGSQAFVEGPFRPELASRTAAHPVVELLPEASANREAWQSLAPLEGANRLSGVRGDGRVLLTHPGVAGAGPMPVLAVGTAGKGRSLALAVDSGWRWGIATAGERGDASAYDRFWDRALRWVAHDPRLDPSRLSTDRERYTPGATLTVEALLRDEDYRPFGQGALELLLSRSDGSVLAAQPLKPDAEGRASAALVVPEQSGGYRLHVRDGERVLTDEGFVVEAAGDELADPRARADRLQELATATKGRYFDVSDAPASLDRFEHSRSQALGTQVLRPFASFGFFVVLALLFAGEWVLRRAWGLR
jgi:uncharacterized membrane protein